MTRTCLAPMILLALGSACGDDAASGPTTVTLTLEDGDPPATSNAELVAFQDGDGPWTVLTGDDGHYQASVTTGRYGFLVACTTSSGSPRTTLFLTTTDEATALTGWSCVSASRPVTIAGTISNGQGLVEVTSLQGVGSVENDGTYTLDTRPGPEQLLVTELDLDTFTTGRMVRRDLGSVTADRTEDVDLADGLLGEVVRPTITGFTAADVAGFSSTDVRSGAGWLRLPFIDFADAPPSYVLLAPAQRLAGDRAAVTLFIDRGDFRDEAPYPTRRVTVDEVTPATTFALPEVRTFAPPAVGPGSLTWSLPALALTSDERLSVTALSFTSSLTIIDASISAARAAEPRELRFGAVPGLAGWDPAWSPVGDTAWYVEVHRDEATGDSSSGTTGSVTVGAPVAGPRPPTRAQVLAARRARLAAALDRSRSR